MFPDAKTDAGSMVDEFKALVLMIPVINMVRQKGHGSEVEIVVALTI